MTQKVLPLITKLQNLTLPPMHAYFARIFWGPVSEIQIWIVFDDATKNKGSYDFILKSNCQFFKIFIFVEKKG